MTSKTGTGTNAVSGQRSAVSGQRSAVSGQRSAVSAFFFLARTFKKADFSSRGVTVLEIIVAMGILAIILAPTFDAFVLTTKSVKITGDLTIATYLSQKIIEDLRYNQYNDGATDFSKFLRDALETGKTISGSDCSKYFKKIFDPDRTDDRNFLGELEKFSINISYDNYSVPRDPKDMEIESQATIDVDGDGIKDPDAAQVTVNVSWTKVEENEKKDYQSKFSTILSKGELHD